MFFRVNIYDRQAFAALIYTVDTHLRIFVKIIGQICPHNLHLFKMSGILKSVITEEPVITTLWTQTCAFQNSKTESSASDALIYFMKMLIFHDICVYYKVFYIKYLRQVFN